MVKNSSGPSRNRVAGRAGRGSRRETSRDVVRNAAANRRGALECRGVATVAIRGIQRVVVAYMAGCAGRWRRRHVRAGQREPGCAVIERGRCPTRRVVAGGTIGRAECGTGSGVHRIIGLLPGGQVALRISAIRGSNRQVVIVVDVASRARDIRVSGGQRKSRGVVIERRGGPAHCSVACRAIRKCECCSRGRMHRVRGRLPGG